jgi:hypothetical protein
MTRWSRYGRAVAGPDELTSRRLERRVLEHLGATPTRASRPMVRAAMAALGLAAALLLAWWMRTPVHERSEEPAWVTIETSARAQELSLPRDGRLWVGADSRVEVATSEASGAVVRLHDGEVGLHVQSGPGLSWRVEVDGFGVEAVGTRFRVRRTSAAPHVSVQEGVVRLTGPGLPDEGVRIAAADLEVIADSGVAVARDALPTEHEVVTPTADSEPDRPPSDRPQPTTTDVDDAGPKPSRDRSPAWLQRFRDGIDAGDDAVAVSALPEGFPTGREALTAAEFLDAGDALAGARQPDRADAAYRAACKRAQAPACGVATFRRALLAARRGEPQEAIRLATHYLDTHPEGSLAAEVLGRRMEWQSVHGSMAAARDDAGDYLARWPDGPRATLAKKILEAPARDP